MKLNYSEKECEYLTDQIVWKQFLEGSPNALSILYERYYKLMRIRAYRLLDDWEAAHEITQEVFIKLMELGDSYAGEGLVIENMGAWLYVWLKRNAQNYIRKSKNRSRILRKIVLPKTPQYSYLDPFELSEEEFKKALTSLKNPTYQIIITMDNVGYDNAEIAERFGKSTAWVSRNRYKARQALSKYYTK